MAQSTVNVLDTQQAQQGVDFVAVILRRKWAIFLITAVGVGIGYLNYSKTTPLYQSIAKVLVIRRLPMYFGERGIVQQQEGPAERNFLSTQAEVITSPMIVQRAVKRFNMQQMRSFTGLEEDYIPSEIRKGLQISNGGETLSTVDANVLRVSYRGPDSGDCATVVNNILAAYKDFLGETNQEVNDHTLQLIADAKDVLQKELAVKETKYNEWRRSSPLVPVTTTQSKNAHAERCQVLEDKRLEVELKLVAMRNHVQNLEQALQKGATKDAVLMLADRFKGSNTGLDAGKAGATASVEQTLLPLMLEEQTLLEVYGTDHPRVKAVRARIQLVQDSMIGSRGNEKAAGDMTTRLLAACMDSQKLELVGLEAEYKTLTENYEREKEAAKADLNAQVQEETMRSDIDRTKRLFDEVVSRLHELTSFKDQGGTQTQVIAPALYGVQVEPVLMRALSVGGALGLVVGMALAFVIDVADKSFRTPVEIRDQLHLPVLGHIPVITADKRRKGKDSSAAAASKIDPTVVCFHRPRSTISEAFRSVRTAIYFGTRGGDYKVIQVTSSEPGDGKTTTTCNLATSIAQSGKRVLLIDADFRRSRVHQIMGLENHAGLSTLIEEKGDFASCIQQTEIANLYVLPAGPRPKNPSELLSAQRFKDVIELLRAKFDAIIVDTPPLLAVTDPCAVAPRMDAVLFVMRITKQVRPNSQRSKEILDSLGTEVLGVIVNGVDMRAIYGHDSGHLKYSTGYGYGYGYRYEEDGSYYDVDEEEPTPSKESVSSEDSANTSSLAS